MRKVKVFLHIFRNSLIPQPSYYRHVLKASLKFSLSYFLLLVTMLNIFIIALFFSLYNPAKISRYLNNIKSSLEAYPQNLVINIHKGTLLTTYNRPYLFWIDVEDKKVLPFVIDETATPQKIKQYQSYVLLTSQDMVVRNTQNSDTPLVMPLLYFNNQLIKRESLTWLIDLLTRIEKNLFFIYIVVFLMLFISLFFASFIITLLYVFFVNCIVFLMMKLFGHKKIHFRKSFQLSLHSVTLPLVVDYFLTVLNLRNSSLPILFLLLSAVFIFAGIYEAYLDSEKVVPIVSSHHRHHS